MQNYSTLNKKRSYSVWIYVIIIGMVVFFTAITIFAFYKLASREPEIDHEIPFILDTNTLIDDRPEQILEGEAPAPVPSSDSSLKFIRRKSVFNILVAGLSEQTDVMMLINFDAANKAASVIQIPRDTYINIDRNFHKLNSYFTGERNTLKRNGMTEKEAEMGAMANLASLLEKNLTVKIDYWAVIDLAGFRNIIDIVGGVEVNVPQDMDYEDPEQNLYIHLKQGVQVLDGAKSEQFVRFREGYALADNGRMDAQKIFMTALIKKIKASLSVDSITKIADQAIEHTLTSLTLQNCVYFGTEALKLDFSKINFMTLPETSVYNTATGAWYSVIVRNEALAMINKYFNVYEQEIPDEIFDINRIFTNTSQKYINDPYNAVTETDPADVGITASEIDENSIYIAPIRN